MGSADDRLENQLAGLRRYARLLTRNAAEADDLAQESLARALERVRAWGHIRNLRAYLFAIARNCHVERQALNRRYVNGAAYDVLADRLEGPATQLAHMELQDLVAAFAKLPNEQREVLVLVGVEGMTYDEAASVMDVPIGTVMSRLSRGREALRRLVSGADEGREPRRATR
jgi:RNA polymerase sigma-70 factor (ECF subfamily)